MHCTVTGGAGFIGSNLALALQKSYDVAVVDNFFTSNSENLSGFEGEVIEDDIRTFRWELLKTDIIFHQAAITGILDTKTGEKMDEKLIMDVDLAASKQILDFATKRNIPLIYASSSMVYGKAKPPFREEDAHRPESSYGIAKWELDKLAAEAMKKAENLIVGLRYSNVFGPRERYKGRLASMVWQICQHLLSGQRPKLFKWGEQKRDQVYVKDAVAGTLLAAKAKESCIVNIGSGKAVTFSHIVAVLNDVIEKSLEPEYIDNPYTHYQEFTQMDLTKAKQLLGYEPQWEFDAAVHDCMKEEGLV